MTEKNILNERLREISERQAEIEVALANRPQDSTYVRQELLSERNTLRALRRVTERKLRDLVATPVKPDERRERFIQAEIANRREGHLRFIERLEHAGEHRQARIWRNELLNLRAQVEREFSA
jgi:hypothetical protein